jgi:H/ACA ribonucleoprotein complex subunit 1
MSRGGRGGFGRGGGVPLCILYVIARPFIVSQEGDLDAVEDHLETSVPPILSSVRSRHPHSSKLTEENACLEMGSFVHAVEDEMLCSSLMPDKVPYFNAPIYLQNKSVIGKVDEILGPINEVYFSVKMGEGMVAGSFKKGDKVYIAGDKLLPIERFLPKPKMAGGALFPSIRLDTSANI